MFTRAKETIKDLFKGSNKYIKGTSVFMFIETSGRDVIFCIKQGKKYYRLDGNEVISNFKNYKALQTIGIWGGGLTDALELFVHLSDENRDKLDKYQEYLQAGFKYGDYLSQSALDNLSHRQNMNHLMPWHKYDKKYLLEIEQYLNKLLKTNKPTLVSYYRSKPLVSYYSCKHEEELTF